MNSEAPAARRGPKPNPDRGTPTGYRVTARTRFELHVAAPFVGTTSLQETIDLAVQEFLAGLRENAAGFVDAVAAAEIHQQKRAGVTRV